MKEPRLTRDSPVSWAELIDSVEVEEPPPCLGTVDPGDDTTVEDRSEGERTVGLYIEDHRDLQLPLELSVARQCLQGEGLVDVHLLGAVQVGAHHLGDPEAAGGTWAVHDVERVDWNVSHEVGHVDQGASGHDAAFL